MQALKRQNIESSRRSNGQEIHVGISDCKVARQPSHLVTVALGSCVGIALYEPVMKVGGLLHIMLPNSKQFPGTVKPAKFADTGIPFMLLEMRRAGARLSHLQVKIAGGAQMFSGRNNNFQLNIGERNIQAVRAVLKQLGLNLLAEDVGGNRGRTMGLDTSTGQVMIHTLGSSVRLI